jgi:hypothetical protein
MNYTQLSTAIQSYCENYDTSTNGFVDNIPTFVQVAEERIYNTVQLPALRKNVTGNMTTNNKYITLPSDWLATYSIARIDTNGEYDYLLDKDVNFIREAYPSPTDTGAPKYYAVFDATTFIIGPTPDQNYGVELHYFYYPQSIVTAGTSWVGTYFESVLFYGSLREALVFQKSEKDIVDNVEQKYQESLSLLKLLGDAKDRMDTFRTEQVRYPVK